MNDSWAFNCPVHGIETQGFCFRAFDKELKEKWLKIVYQFEKASEEELNNFLKEMEEAISNVRINI